MAESSIRTASRRTSSPERIASLSSLSSCCSISVAMFDPTDTRNIRIEYTASCAAPGRFGRRVVWRARSHYHHCAVEIFERLSPTYCWTDPGTSLDGPLVVAFAIVLGIAFLLAIVAWLL